MNTLSTVGSLISRGSKSLNTWSEVTGLGGIIVESLTTATGGGKSMYYDSTAQKIYFTTTNNSFTSNQNMTWSMIPNTGRGYNLFGYDIQTQKMFTLTPPPSGSFSVNTYCDVITQINGSLYVASTAFSSNGYIGVYNLTTLAWSFLSGLSLNNRVQSISYNPTTDEIYIGGNFTSASTGNYITKYNLTTNTQSKINCDGAGLVVSDILFNPVNNYLYIGADTIVNAVTSGGTVAALDGYGICIYDTVNNVWLNINLSIGS